MNKVGIVTYNRLPYVQKCLWSIIASAQQPYELTVIDDGSEDGTKEWLQEMDERGLIHRLVFHNGKGTAYNYNTLFKTTDDWLFMANDDMYFHRGWDIKVNETIEKYKDAGVVSFYNYSRYNFDQGVKQVDDETWTVIRTGLGAAAVYKPLWEHVGRFMFDNRRMAFFSTHFCVKANASDFPKSNHYALRPHYATNMDIPSCDLNERQYCVDNGYRRHSKKHKI